MGKTNLDHSIFIDPDPQPVSELPPKGVGFSGGREKNPAYVALRARLALRPGVDHIVAVLPARNARETKASRHSASALRGTLKRYDIVVTERKVDNEITLYGRYMNGTA